MNFQPALVTYENPLEIQEEIPAAVLDLDPAVARIDAPIMAELTVQKDEENFVASGWATTKLTLVCGRCAGSLPWPIRARIEHVFEAPHPSSIDLIPLIREDLLLELPLNAVCQLSGEGRCPITGEIYKPRPEDKASLAGQEVWDELSKLKPSKPKRKK